MRWPIGEADIEQLLRAKDLEPIGKAASDGEPLLARARRTLAVAEMALTIDPDTAYADAYTAVRLAATGLLAQQGLRPTTAGGHTAVERAMLAQFGRGFAEFGTMRRRRHEIDYPSANFAETPLAEATGVVNTARELIDKAALLLPKLGFFSGA